MMPSLPDELWIRIMEAGIRSAALGCRDLCCLSITCRRLRRLSGDDAIWSALIALDFPQEGRAAASFSSRGPPLSSKALYKTKFERHRTRKRAAWRLAVLRAESEVAQHARELKELRSLIAREREKLKAASTELTNLEKVRRASVAMNVWQPEVVHSSHRQLVEQCTVPIESRVGTLQMELKLCNQQIAIYGKAFSNHKRKLDERKEVLASLKYHPTDSYELDASSKDHNKRQRKSKLCSD